MPNIRGSVHDRRLVAGFVVFLLASSTGFSQSSSAGWLTIDRHNLCVTEGTVDESPGHRFLVNVPKMRAYVTAATIQMAEMRFSYLGPSANQSALGSGEIRQQFGLKLQAQDACNLIYAMWRIAPEPKLVVSVKRNPGAHTSAECRNQGYRNIKPEKSSPVPRLEVGQSHKLSAIMKLDRVRVSADDQVVWEGRIDLDAAALEGPIGIRSDNVRLEFDLKARTSTLNPGHEKACDSRSGSD